jgi:hypothetical protein
MLRGSLGRKCWHATRRLQRRRCTQGGADRRCRQQLPGQWWGRGGVYLVSSFARRTAGSPQDHDGQVWFYDPWERTVTLKTIFGLNRDPAVPGDPVNFDGPDNITVSPHGGLILAEDRSASST